MQYLLKAFNLLNLDTDNDIPAPKMNEHQNVNNEYKAPLRIT